VLTLYLPYGQVVEKALVHIIPSRLSHTSQSFPNKALPEISQMLFHDGVSGALLLAVRVLFRRLALPQAHHEVMVAVVKAIVAAARTLPHAEQLVGKLHPSILWKRRRV
jgi:hypothetical protein